MPPPSSRTRPAPASASEPPSRCSLPAASHPITGNDLVTLQQVGARQDLDRLPPAQHRPGRQQGTDQPRDPQPDGTDLRQLNRPPSLFPPKTGRVPPDRVGSPAGPVPVTGSEEINGNGVQDFNDVVIYFTQTDWIAENEPVGAFDFTRNGRIDFNDIVLLFYGLEGSIHQPPGRVASPGTTRAGGRAQLARMYPAR